MRTTIKALVLGAAMWAGSAAAESNGHTQYNPADGWRANIPAFDATWMTAPGAWDAGLPPAYPAEVDFPGLGDWGVGIPPPRRGGGEYHCLAIGCEDGGKRSDIIQIGDCSKGPC